MNKHIFPLGKSINVRLVSADRVALLNASAAGTYPATTIVIIRLSTAFRQADCPVGVIVNSDGIIRTAAVSDELSFRRAVSCVLELGWHPTADGSGDAPYILRKFAAAEEELKSVLVGVSVGIVEPIGDIDFDRASKLLVRDELTYARRVEIAADIETLRTWIAQHGRLPTFSWTGRREENALAIRAHACVKRLAVADGRPTPLSPYLAASTDNPVRRPRLVTSGGAA